MSTVRTRTPRPASASRPTALLAAVVCTALLAVAPPVPHADATTVPPPATTAAADPRLPVGADAPQLPDWPRAPAVGASAFLLVDAATGQVLAERDAAARRPVASTVKMLTAITARRLLDDLDAPRVVPSAVADVAGSSTGLRPGDVRTGRQLLEAALVRSGNDAAVALAAIAAGSVDAFVAEMRRDADQLGLDGVVLASPTGLQDQNLLSAADLATIALALLADPVLAEVVALRDVDLPGVGPVATRNLLLLDDPTATGIKTGFTSLAGNSVVASAERDGRTLVAVVLDAADADARFADAAALLDHGTAFDVVPLPVLRVACGGPDARAVPSRRAVVVPTGAQPDLTGPAPGCAPATATRAVTLDGRTLAEVAVRVEREAVTGAGGDAAVGRALVDAVQAAMRAASPAA